MNEFLISCIVPVYNCERYLGEALDSILTQSYRPLEVIVADDGSTDGTASVVAGGYGDRVRYLFQTNAGPAAACNLGLSAAQGEFVAFLAADDLWHPQKLERQMACFEAKPELDLCVTRIQNFWVPELAEEAERLRDQRLAEPVPGYTVVTLLARRSLFETVGQFDSELQHGSDLEWFLRAAEHGAIMDMLPDVLVRRRLHDANRSRHLAANSRDAFVRILKASLDRRRRLHGGAPRSYDFPDGQQEHHSQTE
jgi:glycosyltransferase involved in cell wall biosynthesis